MAHDRTASPRSFQVGIALSLALAGSQAAASGFALIEQSVSSMGTAYAGAGTATDDASTAFFNPALMSGMEGRQASFGAHLILPSSEFSKAPGSATGAAYNTNTGPFAGAPIMGTDGGNGGVNSAVPHAAYVMEINDRVKAGVTLNVPFGLSTRYNSDWVGRYSAIDSEIAGLNINPMLSFKVNDRLSLGAGVSAMRVRLSLLFALDTSLLASMPPGTFPDSHAEVDVVDWGYGFNAGLLFEPVDGTRLGLAYRSAVKVDLDGTLSSTFSGQPNTSAVLSDTLPATALVSATHRVNDDWTVMADVLWTEWSELDTLVVQLGTGNTNSIPLHWEDTLRVALGASYRYSDALTLRGGIANDESPVPSPLFRPASLPDEDRFWLTLGAGVVLSKKVSFDVGYAHLFIDDPRINSTDAYSSLGPNNEGFHRLDGTYEASTDILSAQVNWKL